MSNRLLDTEEYIEQAYFFRTYRERLKDNLSAQEILETVHEEVLATSKLPIAIEFLKGEILLTGRICNGMQRLQHYFTPYQTFVMTRAEEDDSRFDQSIALVILERLAEYMGESPTPAGLFVYQFECIARNRLGYDAGMLAMADDPFFDADWRDWIRKVRLRLGSTDFADLIYYRSEYYVEERKRRTGKDERPDVPIFFGVQEGRIAKANRGRDPLFMFAALQRQLGHPSVPRAVAKPAESLFHPALEARLQRIEKQLQMLDTEARGKFDISQFYAEPDQPPAANDS